MKYQFINKKYGRMREQKEYGGWGNGTALYFGGFSGVLFKTSAYAAAVKP